MGAQNSNPYGANYDTDIMFDDETPVHSVTLTNDYYIGETEVTVDLFRKFIDATNYKTDAETGYGNSVGGYVCVPNGDSVMWVWKSDANWKNSYHEQADNTPVVLISKNDAIAFCLWLSGKTGATFRLPTEAEWEFAARGSTSSKGYKYSGSNNVDDVAWHYYNSGNKPHPVAAKQANELGIYDMSGNVHEWCSDWYGDYSASAQVNPTGAETGNLTTKRGGNWGYGIVRCRVTDRSVDRQNMRWDYIGLRLVMVPNSSTKGCDVCK